MPHVLMSRPRRTVAFVLLSLVFLMPAAAQFRVEISGVGATQLPIAVVKFRDEDKSSPLSDEDLVTKLSESGYPLARRTVTKYRKSLGIQSSRQRKVWAD